MSILEQKVNASSALAEIPLQSTEVHHVAPGSLPVTCTILVTVALATGMDAIAHAAVALWGH